MRCLFRSCCSGFCGEATLSIYLILYYEYISLDGGHFQVLDCFGMVRVFFVISYKDKIIHPVDGVRWLLSIFEVEYGKYLTQHSGP